MTTVRKTVLLLSVLLVVLFAAVFSYSNPERITVDIGFARLESISMPLAFTVCFALGWAFGLVCAAVALLRMAGERRRLRRELRLAETEISTLRSLPLQDAN